jgi:symplekin
MRLTIQALALAPSLRPFVVDTLSTVAARAGWAAEPAAWRGWRLAARAAAPDSFPVLLSLPPDVLGSALRGADGAPLRAPLTDYSRLAGCPVAVPPGTRALLDGLEAEAVAARGGGG